MAAIRYRAQAAAQIGSLNISECQLELANTQERIRTRHYDIGLIANDVRESILACNFEACRTFYEQLYIEEERALRRSARSAIR
jgi:hypothetical protein